MILLLPSFSPKIVCLYVCLYERLTPTRGSRWKVKVKKHQHLLSIFNMVATCPLWKTVLHLKGCQMTILFFKTSAIQLGHVCLKDTYGERQQTLKWPISSEHLGTSLSRDTGQLVTIFPTQMRCLPV